VKNAERYYRSMFAAEWNRGTCRDQHMVETLDCAGEIISVHHRPKLPLGAQLAFRRRAGDGDGRPWRIERGQLLRQRYGQMRYSRAFTTYAGTVTAASNWDAPADEASAACVPGSYEELFHRLSAQFLADVARRGLAFRSIKSAEARTGHCVIYLPESERVSHYFKARLAEQLTR